VHEVRESRFVPLTEDNSLVGDELKSIYEPVQRSQRIVEAVKQFKTEFKA
jgi:hypothetical protein